MREVDILPSDISAVNWGVFIMTSLLCFVDELISPNWWESLDLTIKNGQITWATSPTVQRS
jgi:hypothetical protein